MGDPCDLLHSNVALIAVGMGGTSRWWHLASSSRAHTTTAGEERTRLDTAVEEGWMLELQDDIVLQSCSTHTEERGLSVQLHRKEWREYNRSMDPHILRLRLFSLESFVQTSSLVHAYTR